MKHFLLFSASAVLTVSGALAATDGPKSYPNLYIGSVSPDGRYIESTIDGTLTIVDRDTDKEYTYQSDLNNAQIYYSAGDGNCWSANGIMVGNTEVNGGGGYWQNGEWFILPNPDNRNVYPKGINPDGTVICATATIVSSDNAPAGYNDVPLVWTLGTDGKWSVPTVLPYPDKDFTGRTPQAVFPLVISDDGKTIAAQLIDYSGTMPAPMLYTQDDKGEWSYRYVGQDLINPDKLTFPEWEEDAPVAPQPEDFISDPEKKAEWQRLYDAWVDDMQSNPYPDAEDYMSVEDAEKYNAAVAEYNEKATAYNDMLINFLTTFSEVQDKSLFFPINQVYMDGEAKWIALSGTHATFSNPDDPTELIEITSPVVINLADDSTETYSVPDIKNISVSAIAQDGSLLAFTGDANSTAYIKRPGSDWRNLYDWLVDNTPESSHDWLKANLLHTYSYTDYLTGDSYNYVDEPMMELCTCTPDLGVITIRATNIWDLDNDPNDYYGYVIPTNAKISGISAPASEGTLTLTARTGGVIETNRTADIDVYDMQGRHVFNATNANGRIHTGLTPGIYTIKAQTATQTKVLKARF